MAREETVLFTQGAIARRVEELAEEITSVQPRFDIAVPILAGAFVFSADLLRALTKRGLVLPVEFIWLRAYGKAEQPGKVKTLARPGEVVQNKNVLVIDGVLDTGASLTAARELLFGAGAASVASVVAVAKKHLLRVIEANYVGFESGPEFLYGYGMDRAGNDRGLPDIRITRLEG